MILNTQSPSADFITCVSSLKKCRCTWKKKSIKVDKHIQISKILSSKVWLSEFGRPNRSSDTEAASEPSKGMNICLCAHYSDHIRCVTLLWSMFSTGFGGTLSGDLWRVKRTNLLRTKLRGWIQVWMFFGTAKCPPDAVDLINTGWLFGFLVLITGSRIGQYQSQKSSISFWE